MNELLVDSLAEGAVCNPIPGSAELPTGAAWWTVLLKPGVMDPVAESVLHAARDLGIALASVRTFRRYTFSTPEVPAAVAATLRKVLANDAIEQIVAGPLHAGASDPWLHIRISPHHRAAARAGRRRPG